MGLNTSGIQLLLHAKSKGVNFEDTITIGRQGLHLTKEAMQEHLNHFGFQTENADKILTEEQGYAEPFLKMLGAANPHSIDASAYESATYIHDMNQPIGNSLKGNYSMVLDGGSLEHIFNFPVAIKNCMEMLKVGGYYLGISPANNFLGHGFYQFSPELYYRIFNEENGFKVQSMIFFIDHKSTRYYEVSDPNVVKSRVILSNKHPSYLFVMAQKIKDVPLFSNAPQQSDYQNLMWEGKGNIEQVKRNNIKISFSQKLQLYIKKRLNYNKQTGDGNPEFFKQINL
jgi:hypothetical protein